MILELISCTYQNDGAFITTSSCDISNLTYLLILSFGVLLFFVVLGVILLLLK